MRTLWLRTVEGLVCTKFGRALVPHPTLQKHKYQFPLHCFPRRWEGICPPPHTPETQVSISPPLFSQKLGGYLSPTPHSRNTSINFPSTVFPEVGRVFVPHPTLQKHKYQFPLHCYPRCLEGICPPPHTPETQVSMSPPLFSKKMGGYLSPTPHSRNTSINFPSTVFPEFGRALVPLPTLRV